MRFKELFSVIFEYFLDKSRGYYIDEFGDIHPVERSHYEQIIDDFDLASKMESDFEGFFGEPIDYNNDTDIDWTNDYIREFMKDYKIFPIVWDVVGRNVYVRAISRDLNDIQREKIINFCISKNSELHYDMNAFI